MNRLAQSSSPYLLQHKDNPVDWYPWGEEALQRAREENKPILVSIGYSACHWCHVMEHESFEDEGVAEVMNTFFVCVKIDREERPDIDQIYMDAVQAMGLQGGWPLNVFLMPDQKPFYGGTYFPKEQWLQVLKNIGLAYRQHRDQLQESANQFANSLSVPDLERFGLQPQAAQFTEEELAGMFQKFATHFDKERGGLNRAPKFPMPSHWQYLLRYGHLYGETTAKEHAIRTLREMAWGGIYDQLGGGFARYSVDANWFVPHFEKMLYDNAQLISLYAEAYQATKNPLFAKVVHEIISWAERELLSPEGGYYSALDADSEGQEGKFYVWTYQEWEEALGNTAEMLADYYNLTEEGNWEHGNNIPFRREEPEDFARKYELGPPEFMEVLVEGRKKLMEARAQRIRPGLDDKILAGWNGLMLQGLARAARIFPENHYQPLAENLGKFLQQHMLKDGRLYRTYKDGKASLHAYLEDYAAVIGGFTELYQLSFNPEWLQTAEQLTEYVLKNFSDDKEPLFYFTDASGENLIARKKELFDNVIPSSNALMAESLHKLGLLLGKTAYTERASQMLGTMKRLLLTEPQYLTYWASLAIQEARPSTEICILGPDFQTAGREIDRHYLPQALLAASGTATDAVALLQGKAVIEDKTTYYVCFDQACKRPVQHLQEALEALQVEKE